MWKWPDSHPKPKPKVQGTLWGSVCGTHSTEGHGQHRLHLGGLHGPDDPFLVKQCTACQSPELHVFDPNRHKLCVRVRAKFYHKYALQVAPSTGNLGTCVGTWSSEAGPPLLREPAGFWAGQGLLVGSCTAQSAFFCNGTLAPWSAVPKDGETVSGKYGEQQKLLPEPHPPTQLSVSPTRRGLSRKENSRMTQGHRICSQGLGLHPFRSFCCLILSNILWACFLNNKIFCSPFHFRFKMSTFPLLDPCFFLLSPKFHLNLVLIKS